jgi:photosystem II stability/assembly factor-like uncharacterized protein
VAGSVDQGVLQSADGGASWQGASAGLTAVIPLSLSVDPKAPRSVYLGSAATGLFATTDAGATWTRAVRMPAADIVAVVVDPKAHRTVYVATDDKGVLKSSDAGKTWSSAGHAAARPTSGAHGLSTDVHALAIDPRHPTVLYAASRYGYGAAVARSADAGASWRTVFRTEPTLEASVEALAVDPSRPATVYVGTGGLGRHMSAKSWGIFVSRDAGRTWKRIVAGLRKGYGINALAVSPKTGDVYASTGAGVYRLMRGGTRWLRLAAGLPRLPDGKTLAWIGPVAVNPRSGAVYVGDRFGLYELGGGRSPRWRLASPGFAGRPVQALAFSSDGSRAYAATPGHFFTSR